MSLGLASLVQESGLGSSGMALGMYVIFAGAVSPFQTKFPFRVQGLNLLPPRSPLGAEHQVLGFGSGAE